MKQMLAKLQEAVEIRSSLAKQEVLFWQKIKEALEGYEYNHPIRPEYVHAPTSIRKSTLDITYMPCKQAAKYLALSDSTLNKWRVTGGGPPFIKIGRAVRYKVADLDAFLDNNKFPHTSAYGNRK